MAAMSDYLELKILDHILGTASFTMPTNTWVALYTAAPTDAGGGTEVSGNGYARQNVDFAAASAGSAANSNTVTFTASGSWGTIVAIGIFDAVTTGNLLLHQALAASKAVTASGDKLEFAPGDIVFTAA